MIKKWIGRGVLLLSLLAISAFSFLWLGRTEFLARQLEALIKMPVSVADFSISVADLRVRGLRISNFPEGRVDPAFSAQSIYLSFGLIDLLSDPTVVEELVITSPSVGVEMYNAQGTDTNWSRIIEQISVSGQGSAKSSSSSTSQSSQTKAKKESRKFLVKRIVITDTQIQAYHPLIGDKVYKLQPIPKIVIEDIGSGKPVPLRVIIQVIAEAIMREAGGGPGLLKLMKKVVEELPDKMVQDLKKPVESIERNIKEVEKGLKESKEIWKQTKGLFKQRD